MAVNDNLAKAKSELLDAQRQTTDQLTEKVLDLILSKLETLQHSRKRRDIVN